MENYGRLCIINLGLVARVREKSLFLVVQRPVFYRTVFWDTPFLSGLSAPGFLSSLHTVSYFTEWIIAFGKVMVHVH